MTFSTDTLTVKKLVLNDATTATTDMLTLTPSGAVATTAIWKGIYIDGDALDPSGDNAAIEGVYVDLSGVAGATGLEMRGVYTSVPPGLDYEAIHSIGKIKLDNDESTLAAGETATGIDIIVLASGAGGGEYHAIDVATTGTSSATLAALGTHTGIDVIHQHTGSFIAPTQAWTYDDSGGTYGEVTTAFGSAGTDVTIFPDDDDAIFVGANAAFDEIEVILATAASVDIKPTFWYSKAASFTRFFPADDTEGFTQDGIIRFVGSDLTDFAAQSVNSVSKFYIKIVRTKNNVTTDPIEDTIKTLAATECFWNAVGALQVVSAAVPTITTVTTFTASGNLDVGAYDFRAQTLTADSLTSGRVVFAGTDGVLSDDGDFLFATDTLTVTKIGAFEATGAINFGTQNMTNVDIDSGAMDGTIIGDGSAAAGTFAAITGTTLTLSAQSAARAFLPTADQVVPTGTWVRIKLTDEDFDVLGEFDDAEKTGNADQDEANKLHDADGGFEASDVGSQVWNTTDNIYSLVTAYVDATELTLDSDGCPDGNEAYKMYKARFTATVAGKYVIAAVIQYYPSVADKPYAGAIRKNGLVVLYNYTQSSIVTNRITLFICDIVDLSISDYLELDTWHNSGANALVNYDTQWTHFAIHRIS